MPKLTVTNLTTGPYVLQDPTGLPGEDGLTPFSMSLDETGHAGGTDTKAASVTREQLERMRLVLDAAQTASKITWKFEDDSADSADNVRRAVRVALVSPDSPTVKDEVVITKLTIAGAVAVHLPANPPVGMVMEVVDGTGDAGANNITVTPAAGTINGGASVVINTNFGRVILVRYATEWLAIVSTVISSGAAGGDLGGTFPNPTVTATHLAAPLPVAQGGTGVATGTIHGVVVAQTAAAMHVTAAGAAGDVLKGVAGADPAFSKPLLVTADPGTGVAIPVVQDQSVALVIGAGAETNTVAAPSYEGELLVICSKSTAGGTRTVTFSAAFNQAGNTHAAFSTAGQNAAFRGVQVGGALAWRLQNNDGAVLS